MKILSGVILVAACLVAAHAFPGARNGDGDDRNRDTVLILPPDQLMGATDVLENSDENPWNLSGMFRSNLLDRWYSSIQEMRAFMRQMANQIADRMTAGILSSEEDGVPIIRLPEGANTTSVTKVVEGHVVTVNETTYTNGNDTDGIVIRVRVIDVRPENDTIVRGDGDGDGELTTTLPTSTNRRTTTVTNRNEDGTTASRSVETVEDLDNDLFGNQVEPLNA